MFQPVVEFDLLLGTWIEVYRPSPLESGLQFTPDLPIGVAQMQIGRRAAGVQLRGAFQFLHGQLILSELATISWYFNPRK